MVPCLCLKVFGCSGVRSALRLRVEGLSPGPMSLEYRVYALRTLAMAMNNAGICNRLYCTESYRKGRESIMLWLIYYGLIQKSRKSHLYSSMAIGITVLLC